VAQRKTTARRVDGLMIAFLSETRLPFDLIGRRSGALAYQAPFAGSFERRVPGNVDRSSINPAASTVLLASRGEIGQKWDPVVR
jgi:hypothetical protein